MKEFNLNEYLKNPSQKVVTRDGRNVRIVCTDYKNDYPVIGLVTKDVNKEIALNFCEKGRYRFAEGEDSPLDLFFAPNVKEGWINVFDNFPKENHDYFCDKIYKTKEDAEKDVEKHNIINYITTTKIEWEEDENETV